MLNQLINNQMKGKYKENCNRTACQKPGAIYFNHSTKLYYCQECAIAINSANPQFKNEAGHDLCTTWRYLEQQKGVDGGIGLLIVERIDGTAKHAEYTTREKAIEQLEAMKISFPGCYEISGEHLLDGSIELLFTAKALLNTLKFSYRPG